MTKTTKRVVISLIVVIVVSIGSFLGHQYRKTHGVYIETEQVKAGWGYKIYYNGKLMVNQYVMPAVLGNKPFPCEDAAQKTAELVVKKVANKQLPTVSLQEVEGILKENCK